MAAVSDDKPTLAALFAHDTNGFSNGKSEDCCAHDDAPFVGGAHVRRWTIASAISARAIQAGGVSGRESGLSALLECDTGIIVRHLGGMMLLPSLSPGRVIAAGTFSGGADFSSVLAFSARRSAKATSSHKISASQFQLLSPLQPRAICSTSSTGMALTARLWTGMEVQPTLFLPAEAAPPWSARFPFMARPQPLGARALHAP